MAKGEIPDGPKDDYRDGLREKNGMRCAPFEECLRQFTIAILILER